MSQKDKESQEAVALKRQETVRDFLWTLYGDEPPGYLVIFTKPGNRSAAFPAGDHGSAAEHAVAESDTKDVYFNVGLQGKEPERGRGKAETVSAIPGLWMDIDVRGPNHKQEDLPGSVEEAKKVFDWLPQAPTLIVSTGGGLHCYWLFKEPWRLDSHEEWKRARELSRRFQRAIIAKGKEFGWRLDNTSDLARPLRLPGTYNRKGDEPYLVEYLEQHDTEEEYFYDPEDFEANLPTDKSSEPSANTRVANPPEELHPAAQVGPIAEGCSWMRHCRDDAERIPYTDWFHMLGILQRCAEGQEVAHSWSQPYPQYTQEETAAKLIDAAKVGPVTCRYVEEDLGWQGCTRCSNKGRVKSPIVLGRNPRGEMTVEKATSLVQEAVEKYRAGDPGAPFEKEVSRALAWLEKNDLPEFQRLKHELTNVARVPKRDLNNCIKGAKKELEEEERQRARAESMPDRTWLEWAKSLGFSVDEATGDVTGLNHNIFAKHVLSEVTLLVTSDGRFHRYGGGLWSEVSTLEMGRMLHDMMEEVREDIWNAGWEGAVVGSLARKAEFAEVLDQDREHINLANGMFNINTYELVAHDPSFRSSVQLPIALDSGAECSRFLRFLDEVFEGDEQRVMLVQEMLGYCLTPETRAHKSFILTGAGANGKSVLIDVLEALVGKENVSHVPLGELSKPFSRADIVGKLVNVSSENEVEGSKLNTQYFKNLVAGDEVRVERKYEQGFSYRPICKLVFAVNKLPDSRDKSHGFYRRLVLIPFDRIFSGEDDDKHLLEKLLAELPGIFNFAVEGLRRLREREFVFTEAQVVKEQLHDYKSEQNPVIPFLEENIVEGREEDRLFRSEIWKRFKIWCHVHGYNAYFSEVNRNRNKFWADLIAAAKELGIEIPKKPEKTGGERYYKGLALTNDGKRPNVAELFQGTGRPKTEETSDSKSDNQPENEGLEIVMEFLSDEFLADLDDDLVLMEFHYFLELGSGREISWEDWQEEWEESRHEAREAARINLGGHEHVRPKS